MPPRLSPTSLLRIFRNKLKVYLVILSVAALFALAFFSFYFIFQVKNIEIESTIPRNELNGFTDLQNKNLVFISQANVSKNILENNPRVKKAVVEKDYPNSLKIILSEEVPIAYLQVSDGYLILGIEGKILYKKKEKDRPLPVINYYEKLNYYQFAPGNSISFNEIITSLYLLQKIRELNLSVDSVDINSLSMIVCNLKDKKILFTTEKDKNTQVYELSQVVKQFKQQAKDFKVLDLRFDKPVVKF